MSTKVVNLKTERQKRRARTGWTVEELERKAEALRERYKGLGQHEPPNLVSGDMRELLEGKDDDKDE